MSGIARNLNTFIDKYVAIEKAIQQLVCPLSQRYCAVCTGKCCREEFCKESVESTFLSVLVAKQKIRYDDSNGWLSSNGCRLAYGRPLVCYDFFCDDILHVNSTKTGRILALIKDFVSLGNRAHGAAHLLCIDDLDILKPKKIEKLCCKASLILDKLADTRPCIDIL